MLLRLLQTGNHPAVLPVRLALATIAFAHGAQRLLGWFGGFGIYATIAFQRDSYGIPAFLTVCGALLEVFGGLAILLGLLTRLVAFALSVDMLVGLFKVHLANGFFINWFFVPNLGHGIEMNVAVLGLTLCLLISGGGALSVDRKLAPS